MSQRLYSQDYIDQTIALNTLNVNSKHFNNGDYIQILQCSVPVQQNDNSITGGFNIQIAGKLLNEGTVFKNILIQFTYYTCSQDIVNQLNSNQEFSKFLVCIFDDNYKKYCFYVKSKVFDESIKNTIKFSATGTTQDILGLYETKTIYIKENLDYVFSNRWQNYPFVDQTITISVSVQNQSKDNFTKTISLNGFYTHSGLRQAMCFTQTSSNNEFKVVGEFQYDDINDDTLDNPGFYYRLIFIKLNNSFDKKFTVKTSYTGTNILRIIQGQTTGQMQNNVMRLTLQKTPFYYNTVKHIGTSFLPQSPLDTTQNAQFQISDGYINQEWQKDRTITQLEHLVKGDINNYYYPVFKNRLQITDPQAKTSFTFENQQNDFNLEKQIDSFNNSDIGKYLKAERDTTINDFYKITYTATDAFKSLNMEWTNDDYYYFWFQKVNNNEIIDQAANIIFYNNYKNYPLIKNDNQLIMTITNPQTNDDGTNDQLSYNFTDQYTKYYQEDKFLNHNYFRQVFVRSDSNQKGLIYEMEYDYIKDCWFIRVNIPSTNHIQISLQAYNLFKDMGFKVYLYTDNMDNYEQTYTDITDTVKITETDNEVDYEVDYTVQPDGRVMYFITFMTQNTVLKPDTLKIFDWQYQKFQNNSYLGYNGDVKITLDDLLGKTSSSFINYDMYQINQHCDDFNNSFLGQWFKATQDENETNYFKVKYELLQEIRDYPCLYQWNNEEHAINWFEDCNGQKGGSIYFIYPEQDTIKDSKKQNVNSITFDTPDYEQTQGMTALFLMSNDVQANYQINDTTNGNRQGLIAILNKDNNFNYTSNNQPILFKIQTNAQPIRFQLYNENGDRYTGNSLLQVQFYKKEIVQE